MLNYKVKIGLVPDVRDLFDFATRKGIFEPAKGVENKDKAVKFIKENFADEKTEFCDLEWLNELGVLYKNSDVDKVAEYFKNVTDTFISKLPSDYIPYWDMIFGDGSGEPRDTSSASIAACGIMEMNKYIPNEEYMNIAMKMVKSLSEKYNISENPDYNAIISDGIYDCRNSKKPEANIWGDYFYMEALTRIINPDWRIYW